jgi:hypothetical protein
MSSTKFKQNLDVTGDISLSGNISIGGNTLTGDANTDSVTFNADVTSNIIPDVDVTYDLGTSTKTWREVFTSKINSATGDDLDIHSGSDIALYPTGNIWIKQNTKLIFEGTVPDDFEVKLQATSVTADRDIILPDASGTLALTSDIPTDLNELSDSSNLLFDGDYNSLSNTPVIPADISDLTDTTNIIPDATSDLTNDSGYITNTNDTLTLTPQSTEPVSPVTGMLAVSDGVGWDPATDGTEHLNVYLNGAWIQIA